MAPEERFLRTEKKIESLQALRGWAFLGILLCHSYNDVYEVLGKWGVSVFLVLSGFVMMYAYEDRKVECGIMENLKFSFRKIRKLYPLHLIMTFLAAPIVLGGLFGKFVFRDAVMNGAGLLMNLTLLQAWMPKTYYYFSWNGVAWYLSVCVFLYFMFPYIKKRIEGCSGIKTLFLELGIVFALQIGTALIASLLPIPAKLSDDFVRWFTYICPLYRFGDFVIGCYLGCIYKKYSGKETAKVAMTFLEVFAIVLAVVSCLLYKYEVSVLGAGALRYTVLFLPGSVLLVYLFAKRDGWITKVLSNKLLVWLGNLTAYTFLIHQVVVIYLARGYYALFASSNPWLIFGCGFVLSVLLAWIYRRVFSGT